MTMYYPKWDTSFAKQTRAYSLPACNTWIANTRFSSTCRELSYALSSSPNWTRKQKAKREKGGNSSIYSGESGWVPSTKVIMRFRHGSALSSPKMRLASGYKGPLHLQVSLKVKSIKGISKQITWQIIVSVLAYSLCPTVQFPQPWVSYGERLQDKQITECQVPPATQLHSQTSPAQAVGLIHMGHRLFQSMPL